MKITAPLTLSLGLSLFLPPVHADELAPPDVDFFVDIRANRTLMEPFDVSMADGFAVGGGLWMKDLFSERPGRLGLEGQYLRLGDDSQELQSSRAPRLPSETTADFVPQRVDISNLRTVKINGLSLGAIWDSGHGIELRAGGYFYNFKATDRVRRTLVGEEEEQVLVVDDAPVTDSKTGLAPYLGAGVAIPLSERFSLLTEVTVTHLNSETLRSFSLGLRFN